MSPFKLTHSALLCQLTPYCCLQLAGFLQASYKLLEKATGPIIIGALGAVSPTEETWLQQIPGATSDMSVQRRSRTAEILNRPLQLPEFFHVTWRPICSNPWRPEGLRTGASRSFRCQATATFLTALWWSITLWKMEDTDLRRPSLCISKLETSLASPLVSLLSLVVIHPAVFCLVFPVARRVITTVFSQSEEFPVVHLFLRALFGALSGSGVCVAAGALSSSFRCSVFLVFPSMFGSRGRAYLMILIMSVLYRGPISNLQQNAEMAALSLSCNLDLQVNHSMLLWRHAIRPFVVISQELTDDEAKFQSEAQSISKKFQIIRDEVALQYGYDRFKPEPGGGGQSTQEEFTTKTKMQCDSVVDQGVQRCAEWFSHRWQECMEAIPVPVINHILCVSMKFHFLCDVMKVMTPWCREQIPVEGNFGQLFDQLNVSVDLLSREFSTQLVLQEQEQQSVLDGALVDQEFTQAVRKSFLSLNATMKQLLNHLQTILSFTFISVFTQAFKYLRCYRRDICFDNVYVTSYFRKLDARRRKAEKRFLLPLNKLEKNIFIDPCSLKIYPEELKQVMTGVIQVFSVSLLCFVLLTVDFALTHVLDIISRHTFTQFNLTSSHQVDIRVGGDSMIAHLLRTTISAFNISSNLDIATDNRACMSPPASLSAGVYVSCVCCVLLMVLFTCLQVYTNRLRRLIAASYYPKREKKRVLFLYNLQLNRRIYAADRKRISRGQSSRTVLQRINRCVRRLVRRQKREDSEMCYASS
ncbi:E3 ubiquitin-protein ligase DCST1 isoform X2 [Melanotaenia boesemani]|uniref:E3 ubiquitin-protein ligase DCST1 isoform X2 n=1 Tax=Melanotaenia boesemani TaxID=1250792 RepID=UPI001C05BD2B|nr:E3 ubiquitin-protein ligase DCST1 isoform X2 [Melanotaenia boesemani]